MNSRDIVKVGFAVLAAVVSYNFADTIVHAEENSVEPIKETTNTQESDNLVDVIDSVVNPDVSVSTDEKDSITTEYSTHSEPHRPALRATYSIIQSHPIH